MLLQTERRHRHNTNANIDCNYSPNHTMVMLIDLIPLVRHYIMHSGYTGRQLRFLDGRHLY